MRLLVMAITAVALWFGWTTLTEWIEPLALMRWDSTAKDWTAAYFGWDLILGVWPLALIGVLGAGVITLLLGVVALRSAASADQKATIDQLQYLADKATRRADDAEVQAQAAVARKLAQLQQQEAAIKAQTAQLQQTLDAARQREIEAIAAIQQAEHKRVNGHKGFERLRRKLNKLQTDPNALLTFAEQHHPDMVNRDAS